MKVLSLFHDLDIPITDIKSMFRVGRPSAVRTRPVVIKLTSANTKRELLLKAKNLKGNASWNGVVITHDLTKMQCLEDKNFELQLRHEAEKKNSMLTETERLIKVWKIVGGRGRRHLALVPV